MKIFIIEILATFFICYSQAFDVSLISKNSRFGIPSPRRFKHIESLTKARSRRNPIFIQMNKKEREASSTEADHASRSVLPVLSKVSNWASAFCIIDCTILPLITMLLPIMKMNSSASTAIMIHNLGHIFALYFVIPVGLFVSTLKYLSHRKIGNWILAITGLILIYLSNSHNSFALKLLPMNIYDIIHHGVGHRIINTSGCLCLLISNYFVHQSSHHSDKGTGKCCIDDST